MTTESNRREFEEWFYHVKNDSTLHCEKVIAWEAWQVARERQDQLWKLINAIQSETYGGIYAQDVDGMNWFDAVQAMRMTNPPTSEKPLTHTREQYEKLKASGMMWEIFPNFTGNYEEDVLNPPTSEKILNQYR